MNTKKRDADILPEKIMEARNIAQFVGNEMGVSVESILSGKVTKSVSYARKLVIYFVRNETQLQYELIAGLFGWKERHSLACRYYNDIRHLIRLDETVRRDVKMIECKLTENITQFLENDFLMFN